MTLPKFTDDEQYLINSVKSPNALGKYNAFMWAYLLGGVVMVCFAAYYDSVPMMFAAFVMVCGFRIFEDRYESKWIPKWRSIISKFEAASIHNLGDAD